LIEWPERGERALPQADVEIFLDGAPSGHSLRFEGRTPIGAEWVLRVSREPECSAAEH
jgi:tRNA A37 threonylcarbamoyladenosine biosynthesis protein TsaE